MAPTTSAAQHPQPSPNRIPREVYIIHRAYAAADVATSCCSYHSVRLMTKAHWLVRQLPLEKYSRWKKRSRGLSTAEKVEFVLFAKLWTFLLEEVGDFVNGEEGPLKDAYEEVMDELDRSL